MGLFSLLDVDGVSPFVGRLENDFVSRPTLAISLSLWKKERPGRDIVFK